MMIISCSGTTQDTLQIKNPALKDSLRDKSDTTSIIKIPRAADSVQHKTISVLPPAPYDFTDTASVCTRNIISDITFYDSANIVTEIESNSINRFPFLFTEKNRQIQAEARATMIKHLKSGEDLPLRQLHDDWIIGIILLSAFIYSVIRATSKNFLPGLYRFFLFKGINDSSSRDIGGLFLGQSKIYNLISFFNIGLFAYCAASYYNIIPARISGIAFWLYCSGIITVAVILRHIVCIATGIMSGEKDAFYEYLSGIYQSYRFSAIILYILVILLLYTSILPAMECFRIGVAVLVILYLFRIFRLFIIFLKLNISIFYLILYLCALEFLPVVISIKYFTGLG
jgi:hypothetical protein